MGEVNAVPMRINGVEGAAGQVKISGGPGVLETWGMVATKEFFVPVTFGNEMTYRNYYPVARCNAQFEIGWMSFRVPHDFSSIITAEIIVICEATQAAADWDIFSGYAAAGESHDTHSEGDAASTYNVTNDEFEVVDISGILSSLAADDYVGIHLEQGTAGHNVSILGIRFKYS